MKTSAITGLILTLTTITILASCGSTPSQKSEEYEKKSLPLVTLYKIENKPFKHIITVQGNVETEEDILLTSEMGGQITTINVKEGQQVTKGQTIATVDASVLSSNVEELKTQLNYAEFILKKQNELKQRGVGSEFDLETAKNQVESLNARINSLNTQRGKSVIKAPFSGVIDQVFAKNGEMVGPQSPVVRLVNNNSVDIVASISEKHLPKVKVGTPISVTFPNYSDTSISLQITNIGNYIEPTNRTFRVMSSISNNKLLLPNMLAEVHITDLQVNDGTVIPTKAIQKDQDNKDFIFIAKKIGKDYVVERAYIEVISNYDGFTLLKKSTRSLLSNTIVWEGARGIADKDTVRVK